MILWKTVDLPTEPLDLEEVVRKGTNVGWYSLLATFNKVLYDTETPKRDRACKQTQK